MQKLLTMMTCARPVDRCVLSHLPDRPASDWTLNLVGLPHVNIAGSVIYFMDDDNWKASAVITNIQVDFPEGDAMCASVASEHQWEGHIWGLSMHRVS